MVGIVAITATACPAFAQYNIYWGDVHGHTNLSDGKGIVADYFKYARDASKLDFVVVTDHDFGNAAPWRMPKEVWTLIQDKADEYTVNNHFIAIAGYEWTSQPKYWTPEEPLFDGPIKYYNHKNVYFPARVDYLFSAKDAQYNSPDLLVAAVRKHGGLIQNNHPDAGLEGKDQFAYAASACDVIVNTEMGADTVYYSGKRYDLGWETILRAFLNGGGKTGFVKGSDTHEGKPVARTAILARELTREATFDALRHRRNYAITNARIALDLRINGHFMGEEIEIGGKPRIVADIKGTDKVEEVVIVRDGAVIHTLNPSTRDVHFEFEDDGFSGNSYYYLRVTQADKNEHGNPSCAWSSPIWVKKKR